MSKYKDLHFHLPGSVVLGMNAVLKGMWMTDDLSCKLIINNTCQPFITSDHPVVQYNQFLEMHKHPYGSIGIAIKGLQVFLPIGPKHQVILYDSSCYKIGDRRKNIVLSNMMDVENLNKLQVLNCDNIIYFRHLSEMQLDKLLTYRRAKNNHRMVSMEEIGQRPLPNGETSILLHTRVEEYRTRMSLSFIKFTDKAKQYRPSGDVVVLRNDAYGSRRRRV